jgi:ATP-dependent Lhr-like helicase
LVRPLPAEPGPARGTIAATTRARRETTSLAAAVAQQLLTRYGIVTRESVAGEALPGGFGAIYSVLKAMEEAGRIRRGYFVAGLGAAQFAMPGALDLLRSLRDVSDEGPDVITLAATDPANPYGATLKWPASSGDDGVAVAAVGRATERSGGASAGTHTAAAAAQLEATSPARGGRGPTRTVGATVVLVDGALAAYLARGDRQLLTWLPEAEPQRSRTARAIAAALLDRARAGGETPRGMLVEEIDGIPAALHPLAPLFVEAGFASGALGLQMTKSPNPQIPKSPDHQITKSANP